MKFDNYNTRILNQDNIDEIKDIWTESLPENMKSILGNSIIKIYLNKFFKEKTNIAFGLFESKKLIGFVLFGNDEKILNEILKEKLLYLFSSFMLKFFTFKLKIILKYFNVLFFILFSRNFENKLKSKKIELLIIALKNEYQNKALGTHMMKENFSKNKDYFALYNYIYVKTLESTPQSIKFYEKNNFKIIKKLFGRIYLKLDI